MTAIFPGSFDPITLGHLDIIRRIAALYPKVVVAVMQNTHSPKNGLLEPDERAELIREAVEELKNVEVVVFGGFTRDLCARYDAPVLFKGIRGSRDADYEGEIAAANRVFGIETLLLPAKAEFMQISSTMVREFLRHGAPIRQWVPENVAKKLEKTKK